MMNRTAHASREHVVDRIRASHRAEVVLDQPVPGGTARVLDRVLCAVLVDGTLHHYRIVVGPFVYLTPPAWLALASYPTVKDVGLPVPPLTPTRTMEAVQ